MNSYGAFQTYYQLELLKHHSSSQIAWIGSTQAFLMFIVSLAAGALFDAGHLSSLLWGGGGLVVAGMLLVSATSQYWQVFITQAIMMGLGFGCLYLPAPAVVSQYFHASTALAMGTSSAGSAIGTLSHKNHRNIRSLSFSDSLTRVSCRRCHLPNRILSPPTRRRLRLGIPHPRLHPARHIRHPSPNNAI